MTKAYSYTYIPYHVLVHLYVEVIFVLKVVTDRATAVGKV